jgi:hypothetical protein
MLALVALLASACSTPSSLNVGMRQYPTDLELIVMRSTPAPPVPLAIQIAMPVQLPRPIVHRAAPPLAPPEPRPVAVACPTADPLSAPRIVAPDRIRVPPVEATYQFRNTGSYTVDGVETAHVTSVMRTVSNVQSSGEFFTYDVGTAKGNTTTTMSYLVIPESSTPGAGTSVVDEGTVNGLGIGRVNRSIPGQAGLHLQRITTVEPDGTVGVMRPEPPLLLLPFPVILGVEWDTQGTDQASGTTIEFHAQVGRRNEEGSVAPKVRVDACGEFLDAWMVEISDGSAIGVSTDLTFSATLAIGTQFGGLVLEDAVEYGGALNGLTVSSSNRAVIKSEPEINGA